MIGYSNFLTVLSIDDLCNLICLILTVCKYDSLPNSVRIGSDTNMDEIMYEFIYTWIWCHNSIEIILNLANELFLGLCITHGFCWLYFCEYWLYCSCWSIGRRNKMVINRWSILTCDILCKSKRCNSFSEEIDCIVGGGSSDSKYHGSMVISSKFREILKKLGVFVIYFYIVSFVDDDEIYIWKLVSKILENGSLKCREEEVIFHSPILFREYFIFIWFILSEICLIQILEIVCLGVKCFQVEILDNLSPENGRLWSISGFSMYKIISKLIDPIDTIREHEDIESCKFLSIVSAIKSVSKIDNICEVFTDGKCLSTSSCHLKESSGWELWIILSLEGLLNKCCRMVTSSINRHSLVWTSGVGGCFWISVCWWVDWEHTSGVKRVYYM